MEKANLKEYELVREETEFIRDCITTYMGYAISGSGAALFGLAALRVFGTENRIITSYVSFTIALLLSMVLGVLIYKFNSHNRYVGYARVITDERYDFSSKAPPTYDGAHVAWEICMDRLRMINNYPARFNILARAVSIHWQAPNDAAGALDWMLKSYIGGPGAPQIDEERTIRGFRQLGLAILGRSRTNSWAFPPHVVAIFLTLVLIYFLIGAYCTFGVLLDGTNAPELKAVNPELGSASYRFAVLYFFAIGIFVVLIYLWRAFCRRLCLLMEGSTTVDSFSFRFMITRAEFLNSFSITPSYPSMERLMIEESNQQKSFSQPDPILI